MSSSRSRRRLGVAATAVVAALGLAGCAGGVDPGVAVDVDGETLSMRALDAQSVDYCVLSSAGSAAQAAQGQPAPATGDARRSVAVNFIVEQLAEQVAEAQDVTVPRSRAALPPEQVAQAREALGADTFAQVRPLLEEQARISALVAAIGAAQSDFDYAGASDEEVAGAQQQLLQQGSTELQEVLSQADIEVDPRLGINPSTLAPTGRNGSLSVEVSDRPDTTAPAQTCSGG